MGCINHCDGLQVDVVGIVCDPGGVGKVSSVRRSDLGGEVVDLKLVPRLQKDFCRPCTGSIGGGCRCQARAIVDFHFPIGSSFPRNNHGISSSSIQHLQLHGGGAEVAGTQRLQHFSTMGGLKLKATGDSKFPTGGRAYVKQYCTAGIPCGNGYGVAGFCVSHRFTVDHNAACHNAAIFRQFDHQGFTRGTIFFLDLISHPDRYRLTRRH